jgi:hypothetical protein
MVWRRKMRSRFQSHEKGRPNLSGKLELNIPQKNGCLGRAAFWEKFSKKDFTTV